MTKGALYFHFGSKEELALGIFEEQLAVTLPPQASKLQELVDSGLVLALRLRTDPLVRASVGLALDQGRWGWTGPGVPYVDRPDHPDPGRGEGWGRTAAARRSDGDG
ncbi:hypothetical protein ACR6C2_23705 [Streptomyces sp. INA 01156]